MSAKMKIAAGVVVVLFLLPVVGFGVLSILSRRQVSLGVSDGRLTPCPDSPNCVSSQADDESHRIEPLAYSSDAAEAWERLAGVVEQLPRTHVVEQSDRYMHVTFVTALFRYVDDVEFLLDESDGVIHVRSASRVGHSDLGANRERVEAIRRQFAEAFAQ